VDVIAIDRAGKSAATPFRATGITIYLTNGGDLEKAQQMAADEKSNEYPALCGGHSGDLASGTSHPLIEFRCSAPKNRPNPSESGECRTYPVAVTPADNSEGEAEQTEIVGGLLAQRIRMER
jgi:hypothetical protein